MKSMRLRVLAIVVLVLLPACDNWTATWSTGLGNWNMPGLDDQTLRQMVHTSLGGSAVRIEISNIVGTTPLHVEAASVAVSDEPEGPTPDVQAAPVPILFGGVASVDVPAGGQVTSDAVGLTVPADHDIAVSLYFSGPTGPPSFHVWADQTSFVADGNLVADQGAGFASAATTGSGYFLSAVDVLTTTATGSIVAFGDSLIDGVYLAGDTGQRWPALLYDRLAATPANDLGVVDTSSAGMAVGGPDQGLARFDRDVVQQSGVRTVIVLLGINDVLTNRSGPAIAADLQALAAESEAAGIRFIGSTIPPFADVGVTPNATREAQRDSVNEQIRNGALGFDGYVDFDAVLRDDPGGFPDRIRPAYALNGTNFHPNEAGHAAMANAIDLAILDP